MWQRLMSDLSAQGYYCVAPNMRGYSAAARPKSLFEYGADKLIQDVIDIATYFTSEKFHLIGHDWGAAIGWQTVGKFPELFHSWTALSVPHPNALGKAIKSDKVQRKKSQYIFFFCLKWIPEWYLLRKNCRNLKKIWKSATALEVSEYLKILGDKEGLRAALNYYRANFGRNRPRLPKHIITTRTLYIWGIYDVAIGSIAANYCKRYTSGPFIFLELNAGHWLIQTQYEKIYKAIINHLQ